VRGRADANLQERLTSWRCGRDEAPEARDGCVQDAGSVLYLETGGGDLLGDSAAAYTRAAAKHTI